MEYEIYKDLCHKSKAKPPNDFKNIRVHLVYDVKNDGRDKESLVADGHLTEVPLSKICSGVASLKGIRLVLFLEELNGLESWGDIGKNA